MKCGAGHKFKAAQFKARAAVRRVISAFHALHYSYNLSQLLKAAGELRPGDSDMLLRRLEPWPALYTGMCYTESAGISIGIEHIQQ